jgi:hypothetical protein
MLGKRLEKAIKKEYRREKYEHQQRGESLPDSLRASEEEYLADRLDHIQQQLTWIGEADPTPGGTYSNWITKMMLSGSLIFPEDVSKVQGKLKGFQLNQHKLPKEKRDIANYKTYGDLVKTLEQHAGTRGKLEAKRLAIEEGQEILFEKSLQGHTYTVIEVTTIEASAKMARHTEWCVKDPTYSERYLDEGPLFFIDRDGARYVLAHYDGGEYMIMDVYDEPISGDMRVELASILKDLFCPIDDAEFPVSKIDIEEALAYTKEFPHDLETHAKIVKFLQEDAENVVLQKGSLLKLWGLIDGLPREDKEILLEDFATPLAKLYIQPLEKCLAAIQKVKNASGWGKYYERFSLQGIPYKRSATKGFWSRTVRKNALSPHAGIGFCHGTVPDITLLIATLKYFAEPWADGSAKTSNASGCRRLADELENLLFQIVQTYTVKLLSLFGKGTKITKNRILKGTTYQVAEYLWLRVNHPLAPLKISHFDSEDLSEHLHRTGVYGPASAERSGRRRWSRQADLRSDTHLLEKSDPVITALLKQPWFKHAFRRHYIPKVAEWVYKNTNRDLRGLREEVSYLHGVIDKSGTITIYFSYEDVAEDISDENDADDNTDGKEHGNAYDHCAPFKEALDLWDADHLIRSMSAVRKSIDLRATNVYMPKSGDEDRESDDVDDMGFWKDFFLQRLEKGGRYIPLSWDERSNRRELDEAIIDDGFGDWSDEYELEDAYREDDDDEDSDIMLSFKISASREMNIYDVIYILASSVRSSDPKPWD